MQNPPVDKPGGFAFIIS